MKCRLTLVFLLLYLIPQAQVFTNNLLVPKEGQLANIAIVRPRPGGITNIKPAIDLSALFPVPGMQGYTQGSCAAWSVGYGLMSFLKFKQERWQMLNTDGSVNRTRVFSPSFLYNHLTIDPLCKRGIYLNEALQYSIDAGAINLHLFSYDQNSCRRKASGSEKLTALNNRLLSFNKVFDSFEAPYGRLIDPVEVKAQLSDSNAVVLGVHLDQSFIYDYYGERSQGRDRPIIWNVFEYNTLIDTSYHAMVCVGYNDTLSAFKVMNSWGSGFGNNGYVWISEAVFIQAVKEAYTGFLRPKNTRLRPEFARENPNDEENQNLSDALIKDVNWIKKGYYREYADLRIGCLDLDRRQQDAILKLTNTTDNQVISTIYMKVGEDYQVFTYKGREISIRIVKIDNAGRNPFKKAVFYDMKYRKTGDLY